MLERVINSNACIRLMELHNAKAFYNFSISGKEHFIRWIPFISIRKSEDEIRALIQLFLEKLSNGAGYLFGIWDADKIIGIVLVREIDESAGWAEIGYMIDHAYEGKGIIKTACRYLIDYLFKERQLQKIVICCDERNERSIGLAKRLGFVLEGNLRRHSKVNNEICNLLHFGLLKEEYNNT